MTTLSTHVLNTAHGRPAANVAVRLSTAAGVWLFSGITNEDGRCPGLPAITSGRYRLEFSVAEYFRTAGVALSDPPFLDIVAIEFGVASDGHYHVPLVVSPFAYSTYRGS